VPVRTPTEIFESFEELFAQKRVMHSNRTVIESSWTHELIDLYGDIPSRNTLVEVFYESEIQVVNARQFLIEEGASETPRDTRCSTRTLMGLDERADALDLFLEGRSGSNTIGQLVSA
jgi:hypothetical protein